MLSSVVRTDRRCSQSISVSDVLSRTGTHRSEVGFAVLVNVRWRQIGAVLSMQDQHIRLVDDEKQPRTSPAPAGGKIRCHRLPDQTSLRLSMQPRATHAGYWAILHLHTRRTARGLEAANNAAEQAKRWILGRALQSWAGC